MAQKNLLMLVEKEKELLEKEEIGSEKYNASVGRLMKLEQQLADAKDQKTRTVLEGVKVGSGVVIPIGLYVFLAALETQIIPPNAMKKIAESFLPKSKW